MENEKENNSGINTTSILFCLIIGFGWTLSAFLKVLICWPLFFAL